MTRFYLVANLIFVPTNRTDDVPKRQISMIQKLDSRPNKTGSFVILCHDTSNEDASEVQNDIKAIEDAATKTNTKIVYHTMSSLYKVMVKKDP